jgi:hypothetical protein
MTTAMFMATSVLSYSRMLPAEGLTSLHELEIRFVVLDVIGRDAHCGAHPIHGFLEFFRSEKR